MEYHHLHQDNFIQRTVRTYDALRPVIYKILLILYHTQTHPRFHPRSRSHILLEVHLRRS